MTPDTFKETNVNLGAGGNPNTIDLPVAISTEHGTDHKVPFVVSRWKLSKEDLERINERGEVWIAVMGKSQPPICPMTENPFTEAGFKALELHD